MWSVLSDLNAPSWVGQAARNRNTGDVPLTVKLNVGTSSASRESAGIIRSLKRHWQDVTLRAGGTEGIAQDELMGIGPHLNSLDISCMRPPTLPPILPPDDSHPKIHSLTLMHFPVRWNCPAHLSGSLQHLSLISVHEHPPTLLEIYTTLLSCPNLRTFVLRGLLPPNARLPDPLPSIPSNIPLKHLQKMQLELPLDFTSQIFRNIQAPSCRNITLWWVMYSGSRRADSLGTILHQLSERIANLSGPMTGDLMVSDATLYRLRAPELKLSLWMDPSDLEEFANVCFKPQPRIPMEVVWRQPQTRQPGRLTWIDRAFPFTLRLEVRIKESRPDISEVRNLLQYLSSEGDRPFEHLRRLELPYLQDTVGDLVAVFNCWKNHDEEGKTVLLRGASEEDVQLLSTQHPEVRIIKEDRKVWITSLPGGPPSLRCDIPGSLKRGVVALILRL